MRKTRISIELFIVLIGIIAFLPQFHFVITLFKSLAIQVGIGLAVLGIIFLLFKWKRTSVIAFLGTACFLFQTGFWNWGYQDIEENPSIDLVVSHINVLKFNRQHQKLIDAVKLSDTDSDILSFQEVDFEWNDDLINAFIDDFPYLVSHPRILSRAPHQVHWIGHHRTRPWRPV